MKQNGHMQGRRENNGLRVGGGGDINNSKEIKKLFPFFLLCVIGIKALLSFYKQHCNCDK